MRTVPIYRSDTLIAEIKPDTSSVQQKQVMGDNTLNLSFQLDTYTEFQYNDSCTVFNELYKINILPSVNKVSGGYRYSLTLHAEYYDLTKVQFLFLDAANQLTQTDFSLTGTAETFLRVLLLNANRVSPTWKRGDVLSTTYKTLTFSKENCLQAIQRIATEFGTEYWIEGKVVHLNRRRRQSLMRFHFGRNRGVRSFTRQLQNDSRIVTRLYAFGSDKNLPPNYRNGQTTLRMPGGIPFIEKNVSTYGIAEYSVTFSDIFPHRTGRVTNVGDIYTFYDSTNDFDLNQSFVPGLEAKLTFNTGQLSGYTFKIGSYNPTTKEFKILKNTDEKTLDIPSDLLKPAVGDTYVITDIFLPQVYIDKAEGELYTQASVLLSKISRPQYTYSVEIDPLYMQRRGYELGIGYEVVIQDTELQFNERVGVIKATRNIKDENLYQVDIASNRVPGKFDQIQTTTQNTARDVAGLSTTIERLPITNNRQIGTLNVEQGSINFSDLPRYATNDDAKAAGLRVGTLYYRIGFGLDIVQ